MIAQVVTGWLEHSMNDSRNKKLYELGNIIGPLSAGFSAPWWGYNHNMHHMLLIPLDLMMISNINTILLYTLCYT